MADDRLETLPVSDEELCRRYETLYTGAINDILRENNLLYQALPPAIMPLERRVRVAGIAFTIKGMKSLTVDGEMEQRAQMLEALHRHSVVVWDAGEDVFASWGTRHRSVSAASIPTPATSCSPTSMVP